MARTIIFSDSVYTDDVNDPALNKKIIDYLENEKKISLGNTLSNCGGYQTKPVKDETIIKPIFKMAVNLINKDFNFKSKRRLGLCNLWINENKYKDFNRPHVHTDSNLSGVYFVKTHNECGNLVFDRNDISMEFTNNELHYKDTDSWSSYSIVPKDGLLIIFASNMKHFVEPNLTQQSRVSVAFNIRIENGEES
jgi:uncharacterized protein (TIGR02466 family)